MPATSSLSHTAFYSYYSLLPLSLARLYQDSGWHLEHGITEALIFELVFFLGIYMKSVPGSSILISTGSVRNVFVPASWITSVLFFKANFTLEVILVSLFIPFSKSFGLSSASLFALSGKSLIIPPSVAQVKQLKAVLNMSSDYPQRTNEIKTDLVSLDAHVFACSFGSFSSPHTMQTKSCHPSPY